MEKEGFSLFWWIIAAGLGIGAISRLISSSDKEDEKLEELRKINQNLEDIKDKVEYININLDEVKYDVSRMKGTVEDINDNIEISRTV